MSKKNIENFSTKKKLVLKKKFNLQKQKIINGFLINKKKKLDKEQININQFLSIKQKNNFYKKEQEIFLRYLKLKQSIKLKQKYPRYFKYSKAFQAITKNLKYLEKRKRSKFKKTFKIFEKIIRYFFFNISTKPVLSSYIWHNQWNNLHLQYKSLIIYNYFKRVFEKRNLSINSFYVQIYHNKIKVLGHILGFYREYKLRYRAKKLKRLFRKTTLISKLASPLLNLNSVISIKYTFYNVILPKKFIHKNVSRVFGRFKKERFFWESLQLMYGVFKGYVSVNVLTNLIYTYVRKNPRRVAFLAYIKRLLDLHFKMFSKSKIQGVRIEVKGRFTPKSRARKQIISVGRVRIHESSSNVSYSQTEAITKFGSLGIKVWICPL